MSLDEWVNFSGTISCAVPLYCIPQAQDVENAPNGIMRAQGDSLRAIVDYCFNALDTPQRLRTIGGTLSFSRILEPSDVVLDPSNLSNRWLVAPKWLTDDYRNGRLAEGKVPVIVEGGHGIRDLNQWLAEKRLALQTSGAGDGHRIAGCIATGTHGSALGVGAVHDTVLGLHVVVGPDEALFIQSETSPACAPEWAGWLEKHTGIPTTDMPDDDAFRTALVGLGSMGIVASVVIEAVPLYRLERKTLARRASDAELLEAIRTLDTSALHPERTERPHHFEVLFNPYPPENSEGAFITLMWKAPADGIALSGPFQGPTDTSSDTMGLISNLTETFGGDIPSVTTAVLQEIIGSQIRSRTMGSDGTIGFPGEIFGPTTLPKLGGASTEIVVNHDDILQALQVINGALADQAAQGNHLLGAMAVRFIPETEAFLGMNIHPMNCCIELPSIRNHRVQIVFEAIWDALEAANVPFTCHWGQLHGMTRDRIDRYFGNERVRAWQNTRERLLGPTACKVFGAPLLGDVGLDSFEQPSDSPLFAFKD